MKKVYICSPYRPITHKKKKYSTAKNITLAKNACKKAINLGHLPLAPHLYFTMFLNDDNEEERRQGLGYAREWIKASDEMWLVINHGVSEGMKHDIKAATNARKRIILTKIKAAKRKRK